MPNPKMSLAYLDPDQISDNYLNDNHSNNNDHVFLLKGRKFEKDNFGHIMENLLPTRGIPSIYLLGS